MPNWHSLTSRPSKALRSASQSLLIGRIHVQKCDAILTHPVWIIFHLGGFRSISWHMHFKRARVTSGIHPLIALTLNDEFLARCFKPVSAICTEAIYLSIDAGVDIVR